MPYRIEYIHSVCGGRLNTQKRMCLRCKKKWGIIGWWLDPTGIRPIRVKVPYEPVRRTTYANWADKIPFVPQFASLLPNWPRWARILSFVVFIIVVVGVIWLLLM